MAQLGYSDIKITIDIDDPVTISIKKENENYQYDPSESKPPSIFRMPSYFRERNKNLFEPRVVSIGPYHQGAAHLKAMEKQKMRYVHKLQHDNPSMPLDEYVRQIRKLESAARECYYEGIDHMSSDEFITMLVLDSMFIIHVAVSWMFPDPNDRDIVWDISWNLPLIKSDLLLLENQIPFFVLEEVFKLYSTTDEDRYSSSCATPSNFDTSSQESDYEKPTLFEVLVGFLDHGDDNYQIPGSDRNFDHLLNFYYDCYMSIQERKKPLLEKPKPKKIFPSISSSIRRLTMKKNCALGTTTRLPRMIPCATELKEAGITFKRSDSNSIYGVNFSSGVLKIPYISIGENAMPRIMNVIAFEQCSCQDQEQRPFTSFAVLMDCIINTPKDVLILQQAGIIENKLDDENKLAMFFNQLRYCCILDYEKHHLAGLFQEVKKYCDSKWPKYRAKLCRNHFNSPWTIISLIGVLLVLFLAAVQTVYGVLSYYRPPN